MNRKLSLLFSLTRRHFTLFFTNKIRLLYTLLVPVLILIIYILVLRKLLLQNIENTILYMDLGLSVETVKDVVTHAHVLVDSWMLSGIVAMSTISISIQSNNIIVDDKEDGVNRDFIASPVDRKILALSYFLFNFVLTLFLSLMVVFATFAYLGILGEYQLGVGDTFLVFATLIFVTLSSTLLTVLISTFVNKESTLSSIIAVFSTAVGFVMGAYMPLSLFPNWLAAICCLFPGSYGCSLLRYSYLATPLEGFHNYLWIKVPDQAEKIFSELYNSFGYNISFFGNNVTPEIQSIITAVFILLLLFANLFCARYLTKVRSDK